jgi:hypothetical protein
LRRNFTSDHFSETLFHNFGYLVGVEIFSDLACRDVSEYFIIFIKKEFLILFNFKMFRQFNLRLYMINKLFIIFICGILYLGKSLLLKSILLCFFLFEPNFNFFFFNFFFFWFVFMYLMNKASF